MIHIGVNENVYLEKVSLDDKNALELTFGEVGKVKPTSLFANVASDEVVENTDMSVRIFAPLPPKKEDMTEEKKVDLLVSDINKTKGILRHILMGYYTSEDLKGLWAQSFAGLPIDEANFTKQILVKEILEGIHKNMARIFIEKIKPFLGDQTRTFRLLLVRQSKDKHYATFRGRFIDDNPFWEDMQVPKEASKVKFTPWEIEQGLTHGIPVSKDAAADKKDGGSSTGGNSGGSAPLTAANVFGQ